MSVLSRPYFHDEAAAFAKVESILWPDGPVCPHCGCMGRVYALKGVRTKPTKKNPEGVVRHGLKKCGDCRKQFTVRIGTIFEETHLPLTKWLQAIHLMCASKKGVSAHQLHRTLEVTYKTAWFLAHRIREAMRSGDLAPFGEGGGAVEVDETYIGREPGYPKGKSAYHHKLKVLSLIDRNTGRARSIHMDNVNTKQVGLVVAANLSREAALMTDEAPYYRRAGRELVAFHGTVNHNRDEYVSFADPRVHTQTVEGFFSIFKRGMKGVYQHCAARHLHRYLAEFDFRYSNRVTNGVGDPERAVLALQGAAGKRLTYRQPSVS
jgi:transposase-like protein